LRNATESGEINVSPGGALQYGHGAVYCRIPSYLQSMALKVYNPLSAIEIALNSQAHTMIVKSTRPP